MHIIQQSLLNYLSLSTPLFTGFWWHDLHCHHFLLAIKFKNLIPDHIFSWSYWLIKCFFPFSQFTPSSQVGVYGSELTGYNLLLQTKVTKIPPYHRMWLVNCRTCIMQNEKDCSVWLILLILLSKSCYTDFALDFAEVFKTCQQCPWASSAILHVHTKALFSETYKVRHICLTYSVRHINEEASRDTLLWLTQLQTFY